MRSTLTIRLAFFLCVATDAAGNAFLPRFAGDLVATGSPLPPFVAAGLPIAAFWGAVAVAQLSVSVWERGRDHRALLRAALIGCAAGLALAASAGTPLSLTAARLLSGFCYGVAMIVAQDGILRLLGPGARTLASGLYLSTFFAGSIAGTVGGGLAADAWGARGTLTLGALLALVGGVIAARAPHHRERAERSGFPTVLLQDGRFLSLVAFAAFPSRLIISAFLYFLLPLRLHEAGESAATIGSVIMVYGLIMVSTTTFWSRIVDRADCSLTFTALGLALTAASMALIPAGLDGVAGALATTAVLGLAQAIGMSPQVTVLFRIAEPSVQAYGRPAVLGLFRVVERVGLLVGPVAAGFLLEVRDYRGVVAALAALAAASCAAFAGAFLVLRERKAPTPSLKEVP